jgi:gliding motility-associated-like protein
MKKWDKHILFPVIKQAFLSAFLITITNSKSAAQCPSNIDFETGTFAGWQCWAGSVDAVGNQNQITLLPVTTPDPAKHIMLSSNPGDGLDKFAKIPRNCPNGSGHSIQLGNEQNGHFAEGLSYQFAIPATANKFKLLINYALVMQDPDHNDFQQPRFEIETKNITDNVTIPCSTKDFISAHFPLKQTSISVGGIGVLYKDWSGLSINLDGLAGKTIRLFFRTAGCTYIDHFCYAYIDVNSYCDGRFETSAFCPTDTAVNLRAPFGFGSYTWYNSDFSQVLGTNQILHLSPRPASGSQISVEIKPYNGLGCADTLTAILFDTLTVKSNAGPDLTVCNSEVTPIGLPPLPGLVYRWDPATYLSDPNIANPIASPPVPTQYVLTVKSEGGGCAVTDTMMVFTKIQDTKVDLIGKSEYCIGFGPFPFLRVSPADSIQWFKNSVAVTGANQPQYTVIETGKYYAQLFNKSCALPFTTPATAFTIDTAKPGIIYPTVDAAFNFPEPLHARQFGNGVKWAPATSLNNPFSYTPTFTAVAPQLYHILITTASGCITIDTQLVKTHKKIEIYVPTAFTPDGNGSNDRLKPLLMGFVKVNYFRVFDRWGKLLFTMNSDQPGWDGRSNNQPVENQTLVWMIEAVDVDGVVHTKQGTTVIVR